MFAAYGKDKGVCVEGCSVPVPGAWSVSSSPILIGMRCQV